MNSRFSCLIPQVLGFYMWATTPNFLEVFEKIMATEREELLICDFLENQCLFPSEREGNYRWGKDFTKIKLLRTNELADRLLTAL